MHRHSTKHELKQHLGNTLTEYAIIIGLIGLAAVGALNLLGNSVSGQYQNLNQGNAHTTLDKMSSLNFEKDSGSPGSGTGGAPSGPLAVNTSSGGTNATSSEGNQNLATNVSYATGAQLLAMADKITDPSLKAWFLEAANRTFKLSSSQVAYEWSKDPKAVVDKELSKMIEDLNKEVPVTTANSVKSIAQWQGELETHLDALAGYTSADPAQIKMAKDLVASVLNSNTVQYNNAIITTDLSQAEVYNPDVTKIKQEALKALESGATDNNTAITTSLETGVTLDEEATK